MAVQLSKVYRALALGQTGCGGQPEGSASMDLDGGVVPASEDDAVRANAVRPFAFKSLVGKGHAEFSSSRSVDPFHMNCQVPLTILMSRRPLALFHVNGGIRPSSVSLLSHPIPSLNRRQQDALEFFQYLLEQVGRCEHANSERLNLAQLPPTKTAFTFAYEDRVQVRHGMGS